MAYAVKREPQRRRKFDHDEARRLYKKGLSLYEIGVLFDVHPTAVRYAVRQEQRDAESDPRSSTPESSASQCNPSPGQRG